MPAQKPVGNSASANGANAHAEPAIFPSSRSSFTLLPPQQNKRSTLVSEGNREKRRRMHIAQTKARTNQSKTPRRAIHDWDLEKGRSGPWDVSQRLFGRKILDERKCEWPHNRLRTPYSYESNDDDASGPTAFIVFLPVVGRLGRHGTTCRRFCTSTPTAPPITCPSIGYHQPSGAIPPCPYVHQPPVAMIS
jgi:hypothetical protein